MPDQQGVAVRCSAGHLGGTDGAAGAGGVLHHDRSAAQRLAHGFGELAGHQVGGATSGKGYDQGDGLAGEALGKCAGRNGGGQGKGQDLLHVGAPMDVQNLMVVRHTARVMAEIT
jgi:hypothetical protein